MKAWMAGVTAALFLAATPADSAPEIKQQQIRFNKGESGARIKGS